MSSPASALTVRVGVGAPNFGDVVAIARGHALVELSVDALSEIRASRRTVDALACDPKPQYGVSTGFGALATRHIPPAKRTELQRSLLRSHAASSGAEVDREVIRAMMFLRLSTLATGRTGVQEDTALSYGAMLSAGITPVVREYGSLGCSGDLAPLAHCALALIGEGQVRDSEGGAHQHVALESCVVWCGCDSECGRVFCSALSAGRGGGADVSGECEGSRLLVSAAGAEPGDGVF